MIEINKSHCFSEGTGGFQISPRLQELMVYFGQLDCYQKGPEILEKTIGIEVGHSQIHRVADTYGRQVEKRMSTTRALAPLTPEDILYAEVDGSMILTREDGWKEVKVGRVFKSSDCLDSGGKQSWIRHWTQDAFPEAVSILDYYHAAQHLYEFTDSYFKDTNQAENWVKNQKELLLNSQVKQVIQNIETLAPHNKEAQKVMAYYSANQDRMDYQRYRQIGCGIIGSGAIESAHRVLVQKRMKQSGQRWSRRGAQHMLNLRVTYENEKWQTIINLVKTNSRPNAQKHAA